MSQSEQAIAPRSIEDSGLATTTEFSTELSPSAAIAEKQYEIQGAIIVAKRFPRDEDQAFQKLMRVCGRSSFAEEAEYSFPRGGQTVRGPSVNLAREAKRLWGNMRSGFEVLRDDEQGRKIRAWAWDVETNAYEFAEDEFRKLVYRKERRDRNNNVIKPAGWYPPDERDLRELTNRRAAILERNCILQLLPRDLIEEAVEESRKTLTSSAEKDPDAARKKILKAFSEINVSAEMLATYLGHPVAQSSPAEIADLRSIYKSILDGNSTWADYVNGNTEAATEDLKQKTKARSEELKQKLGKTSDAAPAADETAEKKKVRKSMESKIKELGWDDKRVDQFFGGRDINAFNLSELNELNTSLTEILAES